MNACQSAWVFGGMGSWNDMGFNDAATHQKYEELSNKLFKLIHVSLVAAANPWPRPEPEELPKGRKWWQFWKQG